MAGWVAGCLHMKCQGMADEGGWGQVGTLLTGLTLQTGGTCRARLQDEGAGEAGGILGPLHMLVLNLETSQEHSLHSREGHGEGRVNSVVGMVKGQLEGRDAELRM